MNSIGEDIYHLIGTCHHITSSYHPHTNGVDECQNRFTKGFIRKYTNDSQNWLELLEGIVLSKTKLVK